MAGIVGTGKSSVAHALADATGGVVIASDRVRKRQAGLEATARGHAEIYTEERTRATYAGLLERAEPVVRSGRVAILDATYARASLRDELRAWASSHGVASLFQTLGVTDQKMRFYYETGGQILAWVLFVGYIAIPVSILVFGLGNGVVK